MRNFLMGLALLATALAGCVDDDADDGPAGTTGCPLTAFDPEGIQILPATTDPIVDDDGLAWDFATTNKRTCSLPAIGHHDLRDGDPHRYIGEIDMRGDLNLGAVAVLGNGEDAIIYILDITDRAVPLVLSTIAFHDNSYLVDVKISDDGAVLYVASQSTPGPGELTSLPEAGVQSHAGFTVYDIRDPTAPVNMGAVVDSQLGCHMLDPVQVDPTQDAVFCISQHVRSYLIERGGPTIVNLGFVEYIPENEAGVPVPAGVAVGIGGLLSSGPHDMTAYHEGGAFGSGRSYMTVSHWNSGLHVLDFTEAPAVSVAGTWRGEGATHYDGNVHTAMAFDTADGRYIIASPEYTSDGTVPSLWVLKADDFGALELVAEWWHPGEHTSQGLFLTTHQWQVAPTGTDVSPDDIRIYLTYNHAGVWVLDLGQILAGDNQAAILGYNLARAPLNPDEAVSNAILSTWDVNVVDGYIYGSDRATGLWVFHYEEDELGDERLRGFS